MALSLWRMMRRHTCLDHNESTMNGDGECATSLNKVRNVLRLQAFDEKLQPVKQYAYRMDEPMANKNRAIMQWE